ncbi:MAG: CoA transferase [Pseudomonadota bacterium]
MTNRISTAFDELLAIRGGRPAEPPSFTGRDPVFPTHYRVGETAAAVLGAVAVSVSDIWELKTGRRPTTAIDVRRAAAAINSFAYLQRESDDGSYATFGNSPLAAAAYQITQPWPTRDGRWFLPHFGIAHLKKKVLGVLECDDNPASVAAAVRRWNGTDLEAAIAAAGACGAMVRRHDEWLAHPQGHALAAVPVVEIEKIGESDPEPFPASGRALEGIRVLDLTRILAGPVAARTCAEHGADVLMVAARGMPQIKNFVIDLSHGKRSCYLDLNDSREAGQLRELVRGADVFSQGYRPGVLERRGFGVETLAELRPGIVYTTLSCFGQHGPMRDRAGWEQVAQCMVGIAEDCGHASPALLPVPACDYLTGYLGAFGTLVALARRAIEGGSYAVNVSLCQSGMFLHRQGRDADPGEAIEPQSDEVRAWQMNSSGPYGNLRHLAPVIEFSEAKPYWASSSPALGRDPAQWLTRA